MNKTEQTIEVRLSGTIVGRFALTSDYFGAFEYDRDYLRTGVSISPFYLPLKPGVFIAKKNPFEGNFGVFNDSLPEKWGRLLEDRYLVGHGIRPDSLTIMDQLRLIGSSGRGALEYYPKSPVIAEMDDLDYDHLAMEAEKMLNLKDYIGDQIDLLFKIAGSSGGSRPKIFANVGETEWMIKLKGPLNPQNIGKEEYQYALLAKKCGIEMPDIHLFSGKYFGVKRFDRENGLKYHMISAAGLLNADYQKPNLDYTTLLTACFKLTRNIEEVYKLFRLMVFNVCIKNRNDHAKNFSFILRENQWFLSPAYNLMPCSGFNGTHETTLNGQGNPSRNDIFAVAENIGLNKQRVSTIYDEIRNIIPQEG